MYLHHNFLCPPFHYLYIKKKKKRERDLWKDHLKTLFSGYELISLPPLELSFTSLCLTNPYLFLKPSYEVHLSRIASLQVQVKWSTYMYCVVINFPTHSTCDCFSCLYSSLYSSLDHKLYKERHSLNSTKHSVCHIAVI